MICAKNPGPGRARFSALSLLFLCLVPTLLFGQAPTSDIRGAAAAGDAKAQFALGNYYFHSRFVTLDYSDLLTWYRKSSNQGFAPAQTQLASLYENNIGVPEDYKHAATLYRLAANQGYALAQYNLVAMFEDGRGVKRDYKQALAWYRQAVQFEFPAGKALRPVGNCRHEKTRIDRRGLAWTKGRNGSRQSSLWQVL